jgi:hypothetical protein
MENEKAVQKDIQEFRTLLDEKRKEGKWNVIVPTDTFQTPGLFYKPVLEQLKVDPDPTHKEVYKPPGSSKLAFHHTTLQRIGFAAGLIWNAKGYIRMDDGKDKNIVQFKAEAAVRKEDGTYVLLNADYLYDLAVIEEELMLSYGKKYDDLEEKEKKKAPRERWIGERVQRDMIQNRKFRLQKAQAGAMSRVILSIPAPPQHPVSDALKKALLN